MPAARRLQTTRPIRAVIAALPAAFLIVFPLSLAFADPAPAGADASGTATATPAPASTQAPVSSAGAPAPTALSPLAPVLGAQLPQALAPDEAPVPAAIVPAESLAVVDSGSMLDSVVISREFQEGTALDESLATDDIPQGPFLPGEYVEVGPASWYGHDFHGRPTASGEIFDATSHTVAHRHLPLGSVVELVNLENGARTIARVNDRGPFLGNRIVDCSYAVAQELGFVARGVTMVQVTMLELEGAPDAFFGNNVAVAFATEDRAPQLKLAAVFPPAPLIASAGSHIAHAMTHRSAPRPRTETADESWAYRRASLVPFPAFAHAWRWLHDLFADRQPEAPRRPRTRTGFGMHAFFALFWR